MEFWSTLFANVIASLLAVIIGVPLALYVNRRILTYTVKEKRRHLLHSLTKNIKTNLNLIKQMSDRFSNYKQLNPRNAEFSNVDTLLLESTASFKYEVIDNLVLNSKLDAVHDNMKQVNRLLKLQLELAFRIPLPATDVHGSVIQQLEASLGNLKVSLPEVLSLIDEELAKLRPI